MISAVTSGSNLSKKTKDAIEARIQLVENEMLKARLEAEERARQDAQVAEKARIETEERLKQAQIQQALEFERERQRLEIEKQKAVEEALKPKPQAVEEVKVSENGQKIFVLNARFEVPAPWNSNPEKLENALKQKLAEFKSLVSVTCTN